MQPSSLVSEHYDDIYFSAQGGLAEKRHVFLKGNDLPRRWQDRASFTICEAGFGTGLSFLAACEAFFSHPQPHAKLEYIGIEKHPLPATAIRSALEGWRGEIGGVLDDLLSQYPLRVPGFHRLYLAGPDAPLAVLTLVFDDIREALCALDVPAGVDAWFLDGFTPARNPAMWQPEIFSRMARLSTPDATFATFTAAGSVRRGLEEAGFSVRKCPGFGYKHDMMAGSRRTP